MRKKSWIFAIMLTLLCCLAVSSRAISNTGFTVDVFKKDKLDKGLPQGSVISLIQTRDGYLWLGTLGGLVRFDGVQYKVFNEGNTPGITSAEIVYLFEDSQQNLWVGTQTEGILLIKDGRVTGLDIGRGSREGRLISACEDSTGAVWLYTADGQLARYRNGRVDITDAGKGRFSFYRSIIMEPEGLLWVGVDSLQVGLNSKAVGNSDALPPVQQEIGHRKLDLLLPGKKSGYWRLADGRIQKLHGNQVERDLGTYPWKRQAVCAAEDEQGNLIVGTLGDGVWWFDAAGNYKQISDKEGLSHNYVLSLTVDRENSLWVGTDGGGLNRVRRQNFKAAPIGILTVQSVCEDTEGGIWLNSKGGVRHWKGEALHQYGQNQGLFDTNGKSIFVDRNQTVWAGTHSAGLFQLQDGNFRQVPETRNMDRTISAIFEDSKGGLWVGTDGGLACREDKGWKVFTTRDGLSSNRVRAIAEDSQGALWIGTDGGGLNQFRDGKFTLVGKEQGFADEKISAMVVDKEGTLWIGTRGRGLIRLKEGKWTRFRSDEGLVSDSIGYLLNDEQGSLWVGSYAGLMRMQIKELNDFAAGKLPFISCRIYGEQDGLRSSECSAGSQPAACHSKDGTLWFPTTLGLAFVDPAQIKPNTNPPPVVIEYIAVDGQLQNKGGIRTKPPTSITLRPGQERVDIKFTSLNLSAPEKTRFQYKMDGHDKGWIDAGNDRIARYPKLPPGDYTFQVIACNEDGYWNKTGSSIAFIVEPPFWQTRWFTAVATLVTLGLISGMVYYVSTQKLQRQLVSLKHQQALERERQRIARDIHDQVGASLTQVSMLGEMVESDKDVPEEVEIHGQQIAKTARETAKALDEIVWAVNPSNDTLDGLITYFCKYSQEYLSVAGLRYRLDVPEKLPNTTIAPDLRHNIFLAAKEAVTNIVKHSKATEARIRLRLEPNRFTLEIEDNGNGMAGMDPARAKTRNGLTNMRKRLEEVGGSFTIGPGSEGGTLVTLSAPLGNHKFDANKKPV